MGVFSWKGRWRPATALTWESLNYLLWPAVCLNCGVRIGRAADRLCTSCWNDLAWQTASDYCRRCGRPAEAYALIDGGCQACRHVSAMAIDGVARVGEYAGVLRDMIIAFKLGQRTELVNLLGSMAAAALAGSGFADKIDCLVPVPMHWTRRTARGYNQAHLVARYIRRSGVNAVLSPVLKRTRRTPSQTTMRSPGNRMANVAGAFAVRRNSSVTGRSLCLVDDILTTGATLGQCATALRRAGARRVYAVVLAMTRR